MGGDAGSGGGGKVLWARGGPGGGTEFLEEYAQTCGIFTKCGGHGSDGDEDDDSHGLRKYDGPGARRRLSALKAFQRRLSRLSDADSEGARRQLNFTVLMDDDDQEDGPCGPNGTPIIPMSDHEEEGARGGSGPNGTPVLRSPDKGRAAVVAATTPSVGADADHGGLLEGLVGLDDDDSEPGEIMEDLNSKVHAPGLSDDAAGGVSAKMAEGAEDGAIVPSPRSSAKKKNALVVSSADRSSSVPSLPIDFPTHLFPAQQIKWDVVLIDEAHKAKDPASTISHHLRRMRAKSLFLLTGTPIQNELKDMWSLMDICNPGKLGNMQSFAKHFAAPISRGNLLNANVCEVELK